ncbi:HAD family hydrolase [Anaerotalea alkaliphila]|uniref:HAD family hydrolase n=1 Tax=Anaerotalea alkaliphila TaxID=2662126 RepID=A0A7X5KPR1_9FIRM|nr:HAD family hydrolase [Anaerotalea alkaliphila]NDL68777.1 HAD family hydrolase [Anaerotalea alkaliphila]
MDTVFFDLDGTLLPLDQQEFIETYFRYMGAMVSARNIEPKRLIRSIWVGTEAMLENDGSMTNEARFWEAFGQDYGAIGEVDIIQEILGEFYEREFDKARITAKPNPLADACVQALKKKGYALVLATNPLFPRTATHLRMAWAGLELEDFALVTTYENSSYCKPHPGYYREALQRVGRKPQECLMVGNDVQEDMCVAELGMDTYLLEDHMINQGEQDISGIKRGGFGELLEFINSLPEV